MIFAALSHCLSSWQANQIRKENVLLKNKLQESEPYIAMPSDDDTPAETNVIVGEAANDRVLGILKTKARVDPYTFTTAIRLQSRIIFMYVID